MAEINKRYSKFINEELKTETETKTEIKTTLLDQMGRDLTKLAKDGKFDPVIGREKEMDEVVAILARRRKNNPVLIGNPGIGKTAIVEGIAQMIADEKCPDNLIGKRIIEVDLSTIMSGTSLQGDLEKKVKRILLELEHNPDVILFIDELHMLVDSNKPIDVSNMFKPALARGEMRCIGATTNKEYRIIEKDGALERRFQKVQVDEPSMSETIEILNRIKGGYEKFHNVKYTDDAITACVKLAGKYITDRYFPDKAIDLLDEVGARLRVRQTVSKEVKELERELHNLREEKMRLVNNQKYEESAKLRVREVQIVKRLETLTKTENAVEVTKKDVESIMSRKIDIPELKSDDVDDMNKYINLESALKMEIVGQDDAVKRVSKSLRRNVAGLKDPNRPRGVFLFLGSTGTGKCHGRGTKIMMFDGSVKNVEDVIEGDLLMGDDSTPRRVLSLASGRDKMYNIKYKNGSFTCNSEHVLSLKKTGTYEIVNIPLNEYLSKNKTFKHTHKLWKSKIDFDEKNVKIDMNTLLERKKCDKRIQKKSVDLYGFEVEYIGEDEYFGFDIDGNHLYMLGDFTVTHNTYTVKTLAKHVFGSESDIIRVDMSEYGEKHNVARLIGCFHPDTMIQMSSGVNKAIVNVNIGDYVITHNGNKKKVIDKYEYDNTDGYLDSYKISNRNIKLECTPQHEILAIKPTFYNKRVDKNSYNIENAKFYHSHELNVGDIVMYPKSIELDEGDKNVIDIINSDVVPKNIQRHQYQDDKYFYYTIISKDRVGYDGKVYDLSIEGDSTYIANGICVHNSPPGYVGYGEGGQLTEKVRRNPYSIILFDELEKAHPSVLNVLLQVFEDGHLTDGEGRKVDFKNTIIIMTSNIGSRAAATVAAPIGFGNKAAIQEEKTKDIIKNELKERLAPEFLNRIDDIIIFASLTKDNIYNIVDVEVNKLKKRLKDMGYDLEISDNMRQLLADKGYDPSLGARPLKRTIVQYIEDPISEELLRKTLTDKISMDYDKKTDKVLINGNPIIERIVKSWNGFNRLKG